MNGINGKCLVLIRQTVTNQRFPGRLLAFGDARNVLKYYRFWQKSYPAWKKTNRVKIDNALYLFGCDIRTGIMSRDNRINIHTGRERCDRNPLRMVFYYYYLGRIACYIEMNAKRQRKVLRLIFGCEDTTMEVGPIRKQSSLHG